MVTKFYISLSEIDTDESNVHQLKMCNSLNYKIYEIYIFNIKITLYWE